MTSPFITVGPPDTTVDMPPAALAPVASPFITLDSPPLPPPPAGGLVMASPFVTLATVAAPLAAEPVPTWARPPAAARSELTPTAEQSHARDLYLTGGGLVIEAGAGTGKTSTLVQLAEANPRRRGLYVAFNKAIVVEARAKFPGNVMPSTAHSLAWKSVVQSQFSPWAARLQTGRMRSSDIARLLGITDPVTVDTPVGPKVLKPWRLASWVVRALDGFCQTADFAPGARHFPLLTGIDPQGGPYLNNRHLAGELTPFLLRAWVDACDPHGRLPWPHARYLKLWQLSSPNLGQRVIFCDEAQDLSPVIRDVVIGQASAGSQLVWVGDSAQQIYSFTGAVDALRHAQADHRAQLTQSWRFGQPIADTANRLLDVLDASLRLTGNPARGSVVTAIADDMPGVVAVLTRSNAGALHELLGAIDAGIPAHLVGGGSELIAFARAAGDLQDGRRTDHPDLSLFSSWREVLDYVDLDEQGSDLKLLVRLVQRFGWRRIEQAIQRMPAEHNAQLIISTAHKAKGREWDLVRLGDDFPTGIHPLTEQPVPVPAEEVRLLYVAVTRARSVLDISNVEIFGRLADVEVAW